MKSKKVIALLLAALMAFGLAACGAKGNDAPASNNSAPANNSGSLPKVPDDLKIKEEDWPIVDGATAFLPFYTRAAAELLGMPEDKASEMILCSTTDYAYPNLVDGKADIIFCLGPSDEQVEYAKGKNVEFGYVPLLNEAFVFFVNKDNPVDSVTVQQLHDIYAGKITNWKELGGKDESIIAYQRSEGSGSQTGLYKFVITRQDAMDPPLEMRVATMAGIVDVVANYDNAQGGIGYSYLYFVKNQHFDENIKLLKVDGVEPSNEAVSSGKYPMINTAYAVFRASEPADSIVRQIAAWCKGEKARKFAGELSYVVYEAPKGK